MPLHTMNNSNKPFVSIVGGNLVQTVEEGTQGARLRKYEKKDGSMGQKWELVFTSCSGYIEGIRFKDTENGTMCFVEFEDVIVTMNTSTRYFSDFAQKIYNADLSKPVNFHPYDIEVEGGKRKRGVSIKIEDVKLQNAFYDFDAKKNLYGFPEVDEEQKAELKKNYWKVYFAKVEAFLIKKLENLPIPERKAKQVAQVMGGEVIDDGAPPLAIDDLPF